VVINDCIGGDGQLWTFKNGAVTAYGGTKCLDVIGGVNLNGVKLQIWDCSSNSPDQQWFWTTDNHLAWTNHTRCMALTDGSLANNNSIQILDCNGYVGAVSGRLVSDSCIPGGTAINASFARDFSCCKRLTFDALLVWNVGYLSNNLPHTSQIGQTGNNDCGNGSSPTSMCQTLCTRTVNTLNNTLD
jgi:hypothetical protein